MVTVTSVLVGAVLSACNVGASGSVLSILVIVTVFLDSLPAVSVATNSKLPFSVKV